MSAPTASSFLSNSVGELRNVRLHMYYPPIGRRGIGGERSVTWGLELETYVKAVNDQLLLVPMIE
jgi:2-keto-3-deoxy-L-rhamnonate aldolase RhmA